METNQVLCSNLRDKIIILTIHIQSLVSQGGQENRVAFLIKCVDHTHEMIANLELEDKWKKLNILGFLNNA